MKTVIFAALTKFQMDKRGSTAIEYSLIAALVAVAVVAGLTMTSDSLNNTFNDISNSF